MKNSEPRPSSFTSGNRRSVSPMRPVHSTPPLDVRKVVAAERNGDRRLKGGTEAFVRFRERFAGQAEEIISLEIGLGEGVVGHEERDLGVSQRVRLPGMVPNLREMFRNPPAGPTTPGRRIPGR